MRFIEAYEGWHAGELTQTQAAQLLGTCDRSFRRYLARYEEFDLAGLIDKRIEQISHRRAPVDEVMKLFHFHIINIIITSHQPNEADDGATCPLSGGSRVGARDDCASEDHR